CVWCERSGSRSSVLNRLNVCWILTPESSRRHLSVSARRPLVVLICGRRIGDRRTEPRLWYGAGIDARLCRARAELFDCALKLTGGLKARLGAFCERAHYGLFEDERNVRRKLARRPWSLFDLRAHERVVAVGVERQPPGQHLVQKHPERIDVRTRIGLFAFDLFGRHILDGPDQVSGPGHPI